MLDGLLWFHHLSAIILTIHTKSETTVEFPRKFNSTTIMPINWLGIQKYRHYRVTSQRLHGKASVRHKNEHYLSIQKFRPFAFGTQGRVVLC